MTAKKLNLHLQAELIHDREKTGVQKLHMYISDCSVNVSEDGKDLGAINAPIGGGIDLRVDGRTYYISPQEFWRALIEAVSQEEKKNDD